MKQTVFVLMCKRLITEIAAIFDNEEAAISSRNRMVGSFKYSPAMPDIKFQEDDVWIEPMVVQSEA